MVLLFQPKGACSEYPQHVFLWRNKKIIFCILLLSVAMLQYAIFCVFICRRRRRRKKKKKKKMLLLLMLMMMIVMMMMKALYQRQDKMKILKYPMVRI